jgi:ABC-type glycerol-3-phosphate transport system permease component
MMHKKMSSAILVLFLLGSLLPIYWMLNMSFKTNEEIVGVLSLWPRQFTWPTTTRSSPTVLVQRLHQFLIYVA